MKIRIIKNDPPEMGYSDISKYIGQVFEIKDKLFRLSKDIYVNLVRSENSYDEILVLKGEYEIVKE